jgi:hypothetical protein
MTVRARGTDAMPPYGQTVNNGGTARVLLTSRLTQRDAEMVVWTL